MNFDLSIEDFTIILNALHYYKKVEKRGNFQAYDDARVNALRNKLSKQLTEQNLKTYDQIKLPKALRSQSEDRKVDY